MILKTKFNGKWIDYQEYLFYKKQKEMQEKQWLEAHNSNRNNKDDKN